AGRIGEGEGCAAIALHARTAEQRYSGAADWGAIATLKAAVASIPVLGNGDVWLAADALEMTDATGCGGVVAVRGGPGRPARFRALVAALAGREVQPAPRLGEVAAVLVEHAELLVGWFGPDKGVRELRKHTGWYLTGYPAGPELRRRLSQVGGLDELADLL